MRKIMVLSIRCVFVHLDYFYMTSLKKPYKDGPVELQVPSHQMNQLEVQITSLSNKNKTLMEKMANKTNHPITSLPPKVPKQKEVQPKALAVLKTLFTSKGSKHKMMTHFKRSMAHKEAENLYQWCLSMAALDDEALEVVKKGALTFPHLQGELFVIYLVQLTQVSNYSSCG